jgi:hypothetical protein
MRAWLPHTHSQPVKGKPDVDDQLLPVSQQESQPQAEFPDAHLSAPEPDRQCVSSMQLTP